MKRRKVDLLGFCGGDGTAQDILKAVGPNLPVLGVPCGVKVHSSVFAINSRAAAETTLQFLNRTISTKPGEVLDIDEKQYRQNKLLVITSLPTPTPDPCTEPQRALTEQRKPVEPA